MKSLANEAIKLFPLNKSMPKRWTGSEHVDYPSLKVLEIGNSHIIATEFNAVLLSCNS